MTKCLFLKSIFLLLSVYSIAQVEKNNWLVGGDFSYSRFRSGGRDAVNSTHRTIDVNARIGYFLVDKFTAGIQATSTFDKTEYPENTYTSNISRSRSIGLGPFIRYYLLPEDKQVNLLAEAAYYSIFYVNETPGSLARHKDWSYSLSAGPVIYLNSSVGLEFLIAYRKLKTVSADAWGKEVMFKVGFQLHLERAY